MAWSDAARKAAAEARRRHAKPVVISVYGNSVPRKEMADRLRAAKKLVSLKSVHGNPYARTNKVVKSALASARKPRGLSNNPAYGEMFFGPRPTVYSGPRRK